MARNYTCRRNRNKTRRNTKKHRGGRGGLGVGSYGSFDRGTTGASAELYQYTGTPGLSRGGSKKQHKRK